VKVDFEKFKGSLPYASELYGVYQPLIGWKSRLMTRRFEAGINSLNRQFFVELYPRFRPQFTILDFAGDNVQSRVKAFFNLEVASESKLPSPLLGDGSNSLVAKKTIEKIEMSGLDNPETWARFTSQDELANTLTEIQEDIQTEFASAVDAIQKQDIQIVDETLRAVLNPILARESVAAGALQILNHKQESPKLMAMLMSSSTTLAAQDRLRAWERMVDQIHPRKLAIDTAFISPIGLLHLFRQYFFEFDTFLGSPVEHIWLSPGGTVELVEASTRKTLTERLTETFSEAIERSETNASTQDELADAVRQENTSNTKLGVSVNTASSGGLLVFSSQVNTGTSFEINQNSKEAREQTHKGLRQQTEKHSMDLRRSFKSVFRTITEVTDSKSRRYVLSNTTDQLINYELRRKMRQVGVQVQDYGKHLCWQTYVDKPGEQLGIANLIHVSVPNDMQPVQEPQLTPDPQNYKGEAISYSYPWPFTNQSEQFNPESFVYKAFSVKTFSMPPRDGYILDSVELVLLSDPKWYPRYRAFDTREVAPGSGETSENQIEVFYGPPDGTVTAEGPGVQGKPRHPISDEVGRFDLRIIPLYRPSNWLKRQVSEANKSKREQATQEQARQYKEKLFNSVKDRIKLASKIQPRKYEDLREEERIIIYRNLIRQLMQDTGVETAPASVQHLFAELVQSMFDVEKMLYFVAPEWWVPRKLDRSQPSTQMFRPGIDINEFNSYSTVSWGKAANRPDSYYITEDSDRARLGSSLGWLIQLDGDNMRNAFLNAPWVKAVIPIREGKETEAFHWLASPEVEGSRDLEAVYQPANAEELARIRLVLGLPENAVITIREAIQYLIKRVQADQAIARTKQPDDNNPELSYLPADKVYETGFYPLQDSFIAEELDPKDGMQKPFRVFSQWIEVVPTDQIVPVEVKYNPKSGMQE
jgi:hypothetical protein